MIMALSKNVTFWPKGMPGLHRLALLDNFIFLFVEWM